MDPKRSKGTSLGKTSLDGYECSTVHMTEQEGDRGGGTSASTVLVLVYWIWLWLVGKVWSKGRQGGVFVMQGRGRRRGLCRVFVLTAVMHGVAGDDHRRGHGNGGAAHAELIGDGIICTAAARLASRGSWKKRGHGLL